MNNFDHRKREKRERDEAAWEKEVEREKSRRRIPIEALKQISDDLQFLYRSLQSDQGDMRYRVVMSAFQDVRKRLREARQELR